MLKFANIALAFVVEEQHPAHFAIERSDAKKFGPLANHRDGTTSTYLRDLDGNSVEIVLADELVETEPV